MNKNYIPVLIALLVGISIGYFASSQYFARYSIATGSDVGTGVYRLDRRTGQITLHGIAVGGKVIVVDVTNATAATSGHFVPNK